MFIYLAIIKKSKVLIFLISISVTYFIKYISLNAKSKSPTKYNLRHAVYSNIVFVEGPGS